MGARFPSEAKEERAGGNFFYFLTFFFRFYFSLSFFDAFMRSVVIRTRWRAISERSEGRARRGNFFLFFDVFFSFLLFFKFF